MSNIKKIIQYLKIGIRKIIANWRISLYLRFRIFMPKPTKAYYLISNKCNFRCQMCPQWKAGASEIHENYINVDRMKKIIDEMVEVGIMEFGISGGEPLIFKEKTLSLLEYANKKGMHTHFATNGSLITDEIVTEYENIGGGHISLSIDAIGLKHDELRGKNKAFENALQAIKIISKFKNIILKINITLSSENLDHILPILELAKTYRALVFIQPFDPYDYGNRNLEERSRKYNLWIKEQKKPELENLLMKILDFKANNQGIVLNSIAHLTAITEYFCNPEFKTKCTALLDQITIDPFGNVIFCKYGKLGNLNIMSLKKYLDSKMRRVITKDSIECGEGCLLGCMFRPRLYDLLKAGMRQIKKG